MSELESKITLLLPHMTKYSFLSDKCKKRGSGISGVGVFAIKEIPKGELIAAWGGIICDEKEMVRRTKKDPNFTAHPISIFDNLFLIPIKSDLLESSDRFNHSCNPNSGVKGQILLVARHKIHAGEEICFDYETTQIGRMDGLPFDCNCGSKNCRGKITGRAWKDPKFRKANKGFFSWYIEKKIANYMRRK